MTVSAAGTRGQIGGWGEGQFAEVLMGQNPALGLKDRPIFKRPQP